jgi:hypothetical protein
MRTRPINFLTRTSGAGCRGEVLDVIDRCKEEGWEESKQCRLGSLNICPYMERLKTTIVSLDLDCLVEISVEESD